MQAGSSSSTAAAAQQAGSGAFSAADLSQGLEEVKDECECLISLYERGELEVQRLGRTLLTEAQERRGMMSSLLKNKVGSAHRAAEWC